MRFEKRGLMVSVRGYYSSQYGDFGELYLADGPRMTYKEFGDDFTPATPVLLRLLQTTRGNIDATAAMYLTPKYRKAFRKAHPDKKS